MSAIMKGFETSEKNKLLLQCVVNYFLAHQSPKSLSEEPEYINEYQEHIDEYMKYIFYDSVQKNGRLLIEK